MSDVIGGEYERADAMDAQTFVASDFKIMLDISCIYNNHC